MYNNVMHKYTFLLRYIAFTCYIITNQEKQPRNELKLDDFSLI